jgi:predicted pyridoxine 5'-phosphate oxidase superfamily flavin-nucleotide-binding protein
VSSPFHPGEIAVQKHVGVREQARELEGMYRDAIPAGVAALLEQHPFAVLSSQDAAGNLWASPLAGPAGIFSVPDKYDVRIDLARLDPRLDPALVHGDLAGLLVIDFDRRLRIRINGKLHREAETLTLRVSQFYGNCKKYIARRVPTKVDGGTGSPQAVPGRALSESHRALIARADTFFIATQHAESGADASHRGGRPGFVITPDAHTLTWPDYRGNNLFNTIGNLETDPRAGLLFIDFESGTSLQLTGKAKVDFGDASTGAPTGRRMRFDISAARELLPSSALRYTLIEPFPYNPPVE